MRKPDCSCRCDCTGFAWAISIIIGITFAILRYATVIAIQPIFFLVLFVIAVFFLALTLGMSAIAEDVRDDCVCDSILAVITGALGTILTSVILLVVTSFSVQIISAIITGAMFLFFSLLVISTACLIKCLTNCRS